MIDSVILFGILLAIYSPSQKGRKINLPRRSGGRENKSFEIGFNSVRNFPLKKHGCLSIASVVYHLLLFLLLSLYQLASLLYSFPLSLSLYFIFSLLKHRIRNDWKRQKASRNRNPSNCVPHVIARRDITRTARARGVRCCCA